MNSTQVADIVDLMNSEAAPRAERDALAAENARLREAVDALLRTADPAAWHPTYDVMIQRVFRGIDALRAARALVEAPR